MANVFESEARAEKVAKLIETIDRIAVGIDANTVYHWMKSGGDEQWAELSLAAAVKTPSETTRKQVLGVLVRRAWLYDQQEAS